MPAIAFQTLDRTFRDSLAPPSFEIDQQNAGIEIRLVAVKP
ncbi:MAG: hypothetical protein R3B96_16820 [Pirellulaceae bacterium]